MSLYQGSSGSTRLRHISADPPAASDEQLSQPCNASTGSIPSVACSSFGSTVLSHVSQSEISTAEPQPVTTSDIGTALFPTPPNSQTSSSSDSTQFNNSNNALTYPPLLACETNPPPLIRHESSGSEGYQQQGDTIEPLSLETTTRLCHVDPPGPLIPSLAPGPPQLIPIEPPAVIQLKAEPEGATHWHATPNAPWPLPPNAANKLGEESGLSVSGTGLQASRKSIRGMGQWCISRKCRMNYRTKT